jgi:ATP-dependent DNA ligase
VAFDALAAGGQDLRQLSQVERRGRLERLLADAKPPIHLTPMTRDRKQAAEWLERFEGAGLDGVVAKAESGAYQPGKRAMIKIKHERTADCVVGGFRWHKTGRNELVGSLLLGLYDDKGQLHHVGVTSSFTMAKRRELAQELEPLRKNALKDHPWREWAEAGEEGTRMPGGQSRWSAGKDLSWEPLRIERICEVKYDHMQGDRFRHATTFLRWRPDKQPTDCRYDQLEVTTPYELTNVFGA